MELAVLLALTVLLALLARLTALTLLAEQLAGVQNRLATLTREIRADAARDDTARRLQTIPGIGPVTASALVASLPEVSMFRTGRDLSA